MLLIALCNGIKAFAKNYIDTMTSKQGESDSPDISAFGTELLKEHCWVRCVYLATEYNYQKSLADRPAIRLMLCKIKAQQS